MKMEFGIWLGFEGQHGYTMELFVGSNAASPWKKRGTRKGTSPGG